MILSTSKPDPQTMATRSRRTLPFTASPTSPSQLPHIPTSQPSVTLPSLCQTPQISFTALAAPPDQRHLPHSLQLPDLIRRSLSPSPFTSGSRPPCPLIWHADRAHRPSRRLPHCYINPRPRPSCSFPLSHLCSTSAFESLLGRDV